MIETTITVTNIDCPPPFSNNNNDTLAGLDNAGLTDPSRLGIYFYNLKTLLWEKLSNTYVDTASKLAYTNITHFSIYGLGFSPPLANYIAKKDVLRMIVRIVLKPFVLLMKTDLDASKKYQYSYKR